MKDKNINTLSKIIKSIAHPIRLKILCMLVGEAMTVSKIHENFSSSYANVSQHLHKLLNQGVVTRDKQANYIYYSITDGYVELIRILHKSYCHSSGSRAT